MSVSTVFVLVSNLFLHRFEQYPKQWCWAEPPKTAVLNGKWLEF